MIKHLNSEGGSKFYIETNTIVFVRMGKVHKVHRLFANFIQHFGCIIVYVLYPVLFKRLHRRLQRNCKPFLFNHPTSVQK